LWSPVPKLLEAWLFVIMFRYFVWLQKTCYCLHCHPRNSKLYICNDCRVFTIETSWLKLSCKPKRSYFGRRLHGFIWARPIQWYKIYIH
jgi:hypothetical protein